MRPEDIDEISDPPNLRHNPFVCDPRPSGARRGMVASFSRAARSAACHCAWTPSAARPAALSKRSRFHATIAGESTWRRQPSRSASVMLRTKRACPWPRSVSSQISSADAWNSTWTWSQKPVAFSRKAERRTSACSWQALRAGPVLGVGQVLEHPSSRSFFCCSETAKPKFHQGPDGAAKRQEGLESRRQVNRPWEWGPPIGPARCSRRNRSHLCKSDVEQTKRKERKKRTYHYVSSPCPCPATRRSYRIAAPGSAGHRSWAHPPVRNGHPPSRSL